MISRRKASFTERWCYFMKVTTTSLSKQNDRLFVLNYKKSIYRYVLVYIDTLVSVCTLSDWK
jgi:hypothetical protein